MSETKASCVNVLVISSPRSWPVRRPLTTTNLDISTIDIDFSNHAHHVFRKTLKSMLRKINEENIDIILLDVYDVPGLAAIVASKFKDIPIVARQVGDRSGQLKQDQLRTNLENLDILKYMKDWVAYTLAAPILAEADGVIAVSQPLKESIIKNHEFKYDDVEVIPVPLRENRFTPKEQPAKKKRTTILIVTNFKYQGKFLGVCESLQELKGILNGQNDINVVIAGDGKYKSQLVEFITETFSDSVCNRIDVRGYVDDIPGLHEMADVFLYISYVDGYPNAVLEAQAMETPVVTNKSAGMVDQVRHMWSGIFVDPKEQGEIRDTVMALIHNRDFRDYLTENARRQVTTENSMELIGEKMENFIVEIYNNSTANI